MSNYSIQEARFRPDNQVYVEAVIEDAMYIPGSQTLIDPPEYGPALCHATFSTDLFPEDMELGEDTIQEMIEQHIDLDGLEWLLVDTSGD